VRYSADAEPAFVGVCHCKNCQKASGTAFRVVFAVPKPALSVRGALKTFDDRGDSGKTLHRRFCPECGSSIMTEAEVMPVKPAMEIYCDSAQPWVSLDGERQRFPKMPGPA
jgi:hypothetical protein